MELSEKEQAALEHINETSGMFEWLLKHALERRRIEAHKRRNWQSKMAKRAKKRKSK